MVCVPSIADFLFFFTTSVKQPLSISLSSKTQQNIELMTFALTLCANIFVGYLVTPTFFQQITSFSDSFHYTKKQKKNCAWEVLIISHNVHKGSNWYMDTDVKM